MKQLQNLLVGFIVSFIGSVPLGYLNVIGYHLYNRGGMEVLLPYLAGVMIVEGLVIYTTLIFAQRLSRNIRLMRWIKIFSIVFMLGLACYFHLSSGTTALPADTSHQYDGFNPFLKGLIFSSINVMQLPFWTAWNLYVLNEGYITTTRKAAYVTGSLGGTFSGMLVFILALAVLASKSTFLAHYLMPVIVPLVFVGLAIFQTFKLVRGARSTT